jgi:hypothetical protein
VSISIIEDDRRLLKQLLMTNENEMMREVQLLPFVDQMIDLRGVQLLSKSHEALQSNG